MQISAKDDDYKSKNFKRENNMILVTEGRSFLRMNLHKKATQTNDRAS
jgi:hypothetical protein